MPCQIRSDALRTKARRAWRLLLLPGEHDLDDGDDLPVPVLDADAVGTAGIGVFLHFVHEPRLGRRCGHRQTAARFGLRDPSAPVKREHVRDRAADLLVGKGHESGREPAGS